MTPANARISQSSSQEATSRQPHSTTSKPSPVTHNGYDSTTNRAPPKKDAGSAENGIAALAAVLVPPGKEGAATSPVFARASRAAPARALNGSAPQTTAIRGRNTADF